MGFLTSIVSGFVGSGAFFMWGILILQIATIALIIERIYALYLKRDEKGSSLLQHFQNDMNRGLPQKAIERLKSESQSPVARLALAAMDSWSKLGPREEIELRLQNQLQKEVYQLEKGLGYLPTLANLATLMGLLGTIAGLIGAFTSIANMTGVERATFLSKGISLAMNTTAYGLIVAIPTLLAYAILQNQFQKRAQVLQSVAVTILVSLGFQNVSGIQIKKA